MMRVDAHQHYWRVARNDYGWLTPSQGSLFRDFEPGALTEELSACQVCATVVIQAAPTEAETRFLFELARCHASIAGVVGWVDFEAPDATHRIRALLWEGAGRLKGLRPMVQDIADPDWLKRSQLDPAFEALAASGLAFDALVRPHHLEALHERLHRHPRLRAVLDHAGKPDLTTNQFDEWAARIEPLARTTSLHCKLSGLMTQAEPGASAREWDPYVSHIFSCFGPDRVMWGSDWPVLTTRTSYRQWFELARSLVRRHAPAAEDSVFRHNAVRFYRLDLQERSP